MPRKPLSVEEFHAASRELAQLVSNSGIPKTMGVVLVTFVTDEQDHIRHISLVTNCDEEATELLNCLAGEVGAGTYKITSERLARSS